MKILMKRYIFIVIFVLAIFSCGCDFLLGIVYREMAQEKKLFGDVYSEFNPKVKEIQEILREIGYNPGLIDGKLGNKTREGIKVFQQDYGLKVSGYIDKNTWEELNLIHQANVIYLSNVSGEQIQTALKNSGFNPGSIDGKMGDKTKTAIKEFQKANGLVVDGKVGCKTWSKLGRYIFEKVD